MAHTRQSVLPTLRPTFDPFRKEPQLAQQLAEIKRGDSRAAADLLGATRGRWEERAFLTEVIAADTKEVPEWVDEWVGWDSSSSLPPLVRGAMRILWAWEARGSGWAKDVSDEAADVFAERLALAEDDLATAARRDEHDPTPLEGLIRVAAATSADRRDIEALFLEGNRRDPLNYPLCERMLWSLLWKWGGSHRAMFRFARAVFKQAPEGRPVKALLARAHFERRLAFKQERDAHGKAGDGVLGRWYFRNPLVRRELLQVWKQTVGSRLYAPGRYGRVAATYLAFCLSEFSRTEARHALMSTQGYIKGGLYYYLGDEEAVFRVLCEACGVVPGEVGAKN